MHEIIDSPAHIKIGNSLSLCYRGKIKLELET